MSLCEALYGHRPPRPGERTRPDGGETDDARRRPASPRVPGFLRRILLRGLSPRPADRYPSMEALLDALGRDPTRRRLGALGLALALVGLGGTWGWQRWRAAEARAGCALEAQGAAEVWNDQVATVVAARFAATELPFADQTLARAVPWLDRWVAAWREGRREVCLAARGLEGPPPDPRSAGCLDDGLAELTVLVDALMDADATMVGERWERARACPNPARCRDPRWLTQQGPVDREAPPEAVVALRRRLSETTSLLAAGRIDAATEAARRALAEAQDVGDRRLVARARLLLGLAIRDGGDYEQARAELETAYRESVAAGADGQALDATMSLAYVIGDVGSRSAEGLVWAEVGWALVERTGAEHDVAAAELANTVGGIHQGASELAEALAGYEQALEIAELAVGPDHPLPAKIRTNLATVLSDSRPLRRGPRDAPAGPGRHRGGAGARPPGAVDQRQWPGDRPERPGAPRGGPGGLREGDRGARGHRDRLDAPGRAAVQHRQRVSRRRAGRSGPAPVRAGGRRVARRPG